MSDQLEGSSDILSEQVLRIIILTVKAHFYKSGLKANRSKLKS